MRVRLILNSWLPSSESLNLSSDKLINQARYNSEAFDNDFLGSLLEPGRRNSVNGRNLDLNDGGSVTDRPILLTLGIPLYECHLTPLLLILRFHLRPHCRSCQHG